MGHLFPRRTARKAARIFVGSRRVPPPEVERRCESHARVREYPLAPYSGSFSTPFTLKEYYPEYLKGYEFGPVEDEKAKGTVLLVHGINGRALQLHAFTKPLADKGYRVIALDMPGSGGTPGDSAGQTVFARALEGFVTANNIVMISSADSMLPILKGFAQMIGIDGTRAGALLREELERLNGSSDFSLDSVTTSNLVNKIPVPVLDVHDTNDKEVPVFHAHSVAETCRRVMEERNVAKQNKDTNRDKSLDGFDFRFVETQGLGHKRILADNAVVETVVEFVEQSSASRALSKI
ncbi:hypothetical protein HDU93_007116 [Gonapodya sp. JEL0774]|nr:hypothetical protein HDU93_007116 [Gonapodya sp. JEL0774]